MVYNNYEEETAPSTEILCRIAAIRNQYCTSEFFPTIILVPLFFVFVKQLEPCVAVNYFIK